MFMRSGIAKISENAVSHVLRDEAIMTLNQFAAAAVIGSNDASQVLGVEHSRQRRRPNEVAEHHSQLTTLGANLHDRCGRRGWLSHGGDGKLPDRPQNFQSVPESDAELFEMLIGEVGKDGEIYSVFGKTLRVLGHAELFEPNGDLLHPGPLGILRSPLWTDR